MHAQAATRPSALSLLVVLYDIGALLGLAGAGLALLITHGTTFAIASLMAVGIYLGVLIMGHFLWKGFGWARFAFMAILVLDLIARRRRQESSSEL